MKLLLIFVRFKNAGELFKERKFRVLQTYQFNKKRIEVKAKRLYFQKENPFANNLIFRMTNAGYKELFIYSPNCLSILLNG